MFSWSFVGVFLVTLVLVTTTHQQCLPELICTCDPESAQCKACDPLRLEQGLGCKGVNLTFTNDDLHTDGSSNFSEWTGFEVVHSGPNNPILPASKNRYLRSTSGYGQVNFTGGPTTYTNNQGYLYNFDFGCASLAHKNRTAVPCNLQLNGNILLVNSTTFETVNVTTSFGTYSYTPDQGRYPSMTSPYLSGGSLPPGFYPRPGLPDAVFFYTFNATGADGKPVWLYLDNVLYAAYTMEG